MLKNLIGAIAALMIGPVGGALAQPSPDNPLILKFQTGVNENWAFTVGGFAPMVKEVERQTDGALKIQLYHGTTLGNQDKHYDMIQSGIVDMAWVIPTHYPSTFKLTSALYLPFAASSALEASTAANMLYQGGYFGAEFDGFEPIMWTAGAPSVIFLRDKKIEKIEDFRGLKLRTPGGLLSRAVEALGATPVSIPGSEIVTAMDKRIVDGAVYPFTDGAASKLYEVSNYVLDLGMSSVPAAVLMRKDQFEDLPPEYQEVLKEVGRNYSDYVALYLAGADATARKTVAEGGTEIITLPAGELEKATALIDIYSGWVSGYEAEGLPARATYEAYSGLLRTWGEAGLPDLPAK